VHEHEVTLRTALGWDRPWWPSAATLRRSLRHVDVVALETRLQHIQLPPRPHQPPAILQGQALDGKVVRGAGTHGQPVHVVALVRHDGVVLAQTAVAEQANEIVAAPQVLRGRDLTGTVTTMEALLTQRALASQIRRQGGHYLMVVKDNQPDLAAAIATLFADPPWLVHERAAEYAVARTVEKGHGRVETRTLEASPSLNAWLDWPDVGQVVRRTCRRVILATGEVQEAMQVAVTSLPFTLGPAVVAQHWRGHWSIENRVHHVRDVTLREDAGQAYVGATARA
jgi:predicted transposase YbfD/YdcC